MVSCAAVKMKIKPLNQDTMTEIIMPVHRHCDSSWILKLFGYKPGEGYELLEQGFLNENGDFLTRQEAAADAYKCGQIKEPLSVLYSEDVW